MTNQQIKYFTKKSMKPLFELLDKCEGVSQMEKWHPEGDVLVHSLQVFKYALRETDDIDLLLAALLHDVGKAVNTLEHTHESLNLLDPYVSCKTIWLIKNHMRVWDYVLGDMKRLKKCRELAEHPWFPGLIQLARWDKMGRKSNYSPKYDKDMIMEKLNRAAEGHWQGEDPFPMKKYDKYGHVFPTDREFENVKVSIINKNDKKEE